VADVLADQVRASGLHGVAAVDEAHLAVKLAHLHGHGGLAGAGVACEDVVQRRDLGLDAKLAERERVGGVRDRGWWGSKGVGG